MKTKITWVDGVRFQASTESGHNIDIEGAPAEGGQNRGARPMELVLSGAAACTAYDVVLILTRGRQNVSSCVVDVDAERAPEDPKVFTKIHLDYRLKGEGLTRQRVERAVQLSKDKYCSATIMLAKTAAITYSIYLNDERIES